VPDHENEENGKQCADDPPTAMTWGDFGWGQGILRSDHVDSKSLNPRAPAQACSGGDIEV
jgi:hypothetical protein